MRRIVLLLTLLSMACLVSQAARADQTYSYTGNPFTTYNQNEQNLSLTGPGTYACSNGAGECGLSGSITLSGSLGANSYSSGNLADGIGNGLSVLNFSFTDGSNTITNTSNLTNDLFIFQTDASGAITGWTVELSFHDTQNGAVVNFNTQGGGLNQGCNTLMPANTPCTSPFDGSAYETFAQGAYPGSPTLVGDAFVLNHQGAWNAGSSTNNGGSGGTNPVPEPSSLLLLGSGAVYACGALRRKLHR